MTPWQNTKYAGDLKPDTAVVTLEYHDRLHTKIARLTRDRDELRTAARNVVDCFGCGGDPLATAINLVPHVALLAALIGDERATKALNTEKETG